MFYSWTDIEKMGYKKVEDFAHDQKRHIDYEGAVVTSEGIEIRRRQARPDFKPAPSVKKKIIQCKIFPAIGVEGTEAAFNEFCQENDITSENVVKVHYTEGNRIFLVYKN